MLDGLVAGKAHLALLEVSRAELDRMRLLLDRLVACAGETCR